MTEKDFIIIGGGPAGVSAAIYGIRFGLNVLLVSENIGGEVLEAYSVENYPGFKKISGFKLAQKFSQQLEFLKVPINLNRVVRVRKDKARFLIDLSSGEKIYGRAILLATGTKRKKLDVPGENSLSGKGVHYCAVCDGAFYKNKNVAVIGGANAAATAALYLSDIAKSVVILMIEEQMIADHYWQAKINQTKNIAIFPQVQVKEFLGQDSLKEIKIVENNQEKNLPADAVFIEIGAVPNSELAKNLGVKLYADGAVKINRRAETDIKGVYAAGDVAKGFIEMHQIATAIAEGAIAAESAQKYLKTINF